MMTELSAALKPLQSAKVYKILLIEKDYTRKM